jgi:cell division control protein 7
VEDEDLKMVFEIQRTYNLKNRIGTRGFMAPETIFNYFHQGKGVDIWASGIIFLSFLSKKFPVLNMNKFSKINNDVIKEIYPLACIFGKEKIETIAKKYSKLIEN